MRTFYELLDDVELPGRWHIGEIRGHDGMEPRLTAGIPAERDNLIADLPTPGRALDFCLTSFGVPIVKALLGSTISSIAKTDIQCLPVRVGTVSGFEVLNVLRVVHCVDEASSEFIKWTENDHRADLAGQYRQITELHLDQSRIPNGAHCFRIKDWLVGLVVSEDVKTAMEKMGCFGAKFTLL